MTAGRALLSRFVLEWVDAMAPAPSNPSEAIPHATRSRLTSWSVAFGCWTLLVVSSTVSSGLSGIGEGKPFPWWRALAWNLPNYYLWLALTPLVARLARATSGRGWRRELAVQLPCGILIAALQTVCQLLLYARLRAGDPDGGVVVGALFRQDFIYSLHLGVLTYLVLLVIVRGLDSRRRLKDERTRAAQLEAQLGQAQLQALRTQLQPHFLFNTLNAISALTLADPALARTMLARLSDFLRLTLEDRDARTVPLARELQFLECYLAIQRVRFQDRLATRLELAEDTLQASVPQLLLQPLVENALHHGLLPKPGRGTLTLTSRREGNELSLVVEDDGLGLPPEGALAEGIGLRNTRERLRAISAQATRLDLSRRPEGGTRVELRLPFEEIG